jgi:prepilin-type N-terminal cleavage/methylation domain-containing protein
MRPTVESWLGFENRHIKNPGRRRIAKRCDTVAAQRLEGSRFAVSQLCKLAAGGSRERPSAGHFYRWQRPNRSPSEQRRWGKVLRWVIPGSRLLPSDRTAILRSGSPPRVGHAQARVLIGKIRTKRTAGFSLIEMLVVVTIIAAIAALITTSVMSALQQQNARVCQNNMLTIEAAKDEYIRDHPGATSIDPSAFTQYFRFGIPHCPDGGSYQQNLYSLTQQVSCTIHGALQAFPSPTP